jgi:2-polyprenyl-3-methyl-5-hydroxy-6-metoxy-1,4-benzoquinol methylase
MMNCIICKKSNSEGIYNGLMQCKNCGLVYYDHAGNINTNDLYSEDYFKGEEYLDYENDKLIIQKNFEHRLNEIRKYIKSGSLYEIGSAYGFFLELAKKYFNVEGIDVTSEPTEYARKELSLDVNTGSYLEKTLSEKKDVFCMWDTIEHLENPEKFIEKIGKEIKTGGYLFLSTGDIGSLMAKIRKGKWRMIHPPTHIFYFSNKNLKALLEKNGFTVLNISHPGMYRSLKQIIYSLFFLNRRKPSKFMEKVISKFDFPVYINTFDIMVIVAKKNDEYTHLYNCLFDK